LVADYVSGVEVMELARRYGIARQTVLNHARRQGQPKRHPKLSPTAVEKAAGLYEKGWSLAQVGRWFGVNPTTIDRVLRANGTAIRPRSGWDVRSS
jgi:transposase-like protein